MTLQPLQEKQSEAQGFSSLIRALPSSENAVGAGKAVFVRSTQARRPRHHIHKIPKVFMSFYSGLFASHVLIQCTNGRIVLISYKYRRFDTKQGHKVYFVTLKNSIGTI